jgi:hypothetical protein
LKIKYILYNSDDKDYIFDSRADAEEFIFSEVEEKVYTYACSNRTTTEDWLNHHRKRWENIWGGERFKTFEGYLLYTFYTPYGNIREAVAFED